MKPVVRISLTTLTTLAILGFATSAAAHNWGQKSAGETPTMSDLIPRMSSGQAYTERYSYAVDFDEGGHVGFNFTISNLGVRSGYGAAEVRVRHPDHSSHNYSERESRSNWSYDENTFGLDIADAEIRADGDDAFEFRYDGGDVRAELRFELQMDMWRPGAGEIRSGDDYYRFTLVAPRSNVTGRLFLDGEWHDVTGTNSGYADHVATNVAPFDLGKRFTRFRNYNDDAFILWREVHLTSEYGGGTATWVVVGVDDEIVYEDADAELQFGNLERDEETRYQVPHAAQVASSQGDSRLRFLLRGDEVNRRDLLESYGRIARTIASRFSKPFEYNVKGDYVLEVVVDGEPVRLRGSSHFTVDYVNH